MGRLSSITVGGCSPEAPTFTQHSQAMALMLTKQVGVA